MRLTLACPEGLIDQANHMAMVLGRGLPDGNTFGTAVLQDASGARYAAASFEGSEAWLEAACLPLIAPGWDADGVTDLRKAQVAADRLVIWRAHSRPETPPPTAAPGTVVAIAGLSGPEALSAMALIFVDTGDEGM
jgi:hypothetical protein